MKIKIMKTKGILIITAIIGIAIGLGSCKKDLALDPPSGVTVENYFINGKDITASLAGIYSAFQEEMMGTGTSADEGLGGRYHYWGDARTETFHYSTFSTNSVVEMTNNTLEFGNSATDWGGLYRVIARCNLGIQYYPQVIKTDLNLTQVSAIFILYVYGEMRQCGQSLIPIY
jgi:hypothetical protein